jgi:CheY-like chemotaxis protein
MIPTEMPFVHKVLLVGDDDAVRTMMCVTLENKGGGYPLDSPSRNRRGYTQRETTIRGGRVSEADTHHKGFEVVAAASVTEALKHIATDRFDVLITDLHMPNPGDGFTVVTAMRHSQPEALTLLVSGYPDVQSAMAAILLEADEIMVKPFDMENLLILSAKNAEPQTCCQARKGESGRDPPALHRQGSRRLVVAGKTEQRTQPYCAKRRRAYWTPP